MKRIKAIAFSLVAATLTVSAFSSLGYAQPAPTQAPAVTVDAPADPMGQCWRRLGPFATQHRAYQVRRYARQQGYVVGPVYGQGGIVTRSGRRYFFRVYYRC